MTLARPRLVYVVTHPVTADLLLAGQLAFLRERGFDVTVIAGPGPELERVERREGVRVVGLPMERAPNPKADLVSVARLTRELHHLRPDIVNASTPKGGLLGMMAARALRVPVRVYLLRGLRLETAHGNLRRVLSATERIASACAHEVVCVSTSLRDAAVSGGHVDPRKARVLGDGSSNGVDVDRFQRTDDRLRDGKAVLAKHGVTDEDELVGFVGRFDPDKGIGDLLDAMTLVRASRPRAKLLLIGGGFAGDDDEPLAKRIRATPWAIAYGKSDDLAPLYARMDLLAFPSYREGFPNVPLEAACAEVPTVGFAATGVVDAVVDGQTGTIVPMRDVSALAAAITRYLEEPALRRSHGVAARARAAMRFSRATVWTNWEAYYRERLTRARAYG